MIAVTKVEVVGEDSQLKVLLTLVGPILIAGAAVFAAWVARKTTNERQAEQLAHDSERQEMQLEHDREIRDREHLRNVMEGVFTGIAQALDVVADVAVSVGAYEQLEEKMTTVDSLPESEAQEKNDEIRKGLAELNGLVEKAGDATNSLMYDTARLRLYLGKEDPVVLAHTVLREKLTDWFDALLEAFPEVRDEAQKAEVSQLQKTFRWAMADFESSSLNRFGVAL